MYGKLQTKDTYITLIFVQTYISSANLSTSYSGHLSFEIPVVPSCPDATFGPTSKPKKFSDGDRSIGIHVYNSSLPPVYPHGTLPIVQKAPL